MVVRAGNAGNARRVRTPVRTSRARRSGELVDRLREPQQHVELREVHPAENRKTSGTSTGASSSTVS